MLLDPSNINYELSKAGEETTKKGKKYFESHRVKILKVDKKDDINYDVYTKVFEENDYGVHIKKVNDRLLYACSCGEGIQSKKPCKHIIATFFDMYISPESYENFIEEKKNDKFYTNYESNNMKVSKEKVLEPEKVKKEDSLLAYYESLALFELNSNEISNKVKIVPIIVLNYLGRSIQVTFKIGIDKLYVIKDIYKFGESLKNKEVVKYGKDLEFKHSIEAFDEDSKEIVRYIDKRVADLSLFSECGNYKFNVSREYKDVLILNYGSLDEFFDIMKDKNVLIRGYNVDEDESIGFVEDNPLLDFDIKYNDNEGISIYHDNMNYYLFTGQNYIYILKDKKLYRCSNDFKKEILPTLIAYKNTKSNKIIIEPDDVASFCGYVLPRLKEETNVIYDEKLIESHMPDKLGVKVFLDLDEKNNIIADVRFCYNEVEFNPLEQNSNIKCNRNVIEEITAQTIFRNYKFLTDEKKKVLYLIDEEDIYTFIQEGINVFMEKFEVLVTDKFRSRQIVSSKVISMGIKVQNNLLEINIDNIGLNGSELKDALKSYKLKKKYYRLKDGSYINIEDSSIETLAKMVDNLGISENDIVKGRFVLPKYRAVYLDNIAKRNANILLDRDNEFREIIKDIKEIEDSNFNVPTEINGVLREYQKTGFIWLKTLAKYNFGGILADDMGLRKNNTSNYFTYR